MSENKTGKKSGSFPHALIVVAAIVLLAAVLSWTIPSGSYDYQEIDVNGTIRRVALAGTYHEIDKSEVSPTGFLGFFASLYRGCVEAADIIFLVFCCCGSFGVMVKTGTFHSGIGVLLKQLGRKGPWMVLLLMTVFGLGGSVFGMASSFYGFYPIIIALGIAMGYDAMFGFAVIACGGFYGFMGATLNPYTVGIAQNIVGLKLYSGIGFRILCFVCFELLAFVYILRYAKKIKKDPKASVLYGIPSDYHRSCESLDEYRFTVSDALVLVDMLVTLVVLVLGLTKWGWGFAQQSGLFLLMSMIAALFKKWSPNQWCAEFIDSAKMVMTGCILIGVAKAIVVVMEDASVMDTVIYAFSQLLQDAPSAVSAELMLLAQTMINFFIPSGSCQAVVTMPIMAQLSDMVGMSRQVAVLALQFGDGLTNIFWPTADIVIICGLANIKLEKWYKWFTPLFLMTLALQMILIEIAVLIGY